MTIELIIDDSLTPPPATMASPQWWGADSERSRMRDRSTGAVVFTKTLSAGARTYLDVESSFAVTVAAGHADVGPRVLEADVDSGRLVLADLTDTHATASLVDFNESHQRSALIAARRAVWALDVPRARAATVFDDVRDLYGRLTAAGAMLPSDLTWMLRVMADAEARITAGGTDTALIHGDANCSNVAINRTTGEIALLDFDWAARADPIQDIGSLLLELAFSGDAAAALFEEAWGRFDAALYARARCYAAAEALRGGLIGAWADHCDPGTHEYSKFSDWMFLWARTSIGDRAMDDLLRRL